MRSILIILILAAISSHALAQSDTTQCPVLKCTEDGIGIGVTSVPTDYKLAVGGKAIMEVGRVDVASQWPDYVFGKDYHLLTPSELKAYIEKNGHLPNVPSAARVKAEGLDVAEINVLLVQKIEELSLHIIQLQQRINTLKGENDQQKSEAKK